MFRRNRKLEGASSHASLARSAAVAWAGAVAAVASLAALPAVPWLQAALVPAWIATAIALTARVARGARAFSRLGAARGFVFPGDRIPAERADADATWRAEWVPFAREVASERRPGGVARVWRKRLVADAAWTATLDAQQAWLRRQAPERWRVASRWWRTTHLERALRRRHGARAWTRGEIDAAAGDLAVELRIAVAIAGQPALWRSRLGTGGESRAWAALGRELAALPDGGIARGARHADFPRHGQPRRARLFLGRGFAWDVRHSQAIEDLKLRDLSEVTTDPREQGDPRIYGVGDGEARDVFLEEAQLNQMAGIFGATGVGKTRYAEVVIAQAIRSGHPVVIIDPKGDEALIDRVVDECRRAGRGHRFRYFCLAPPRERRTWAHLAAYNPCGTYTDPAELASRIASVLPATKDPFWTNVAKSLSETCLTLCHWTNRYLRLVGRGRGAPSARGDAGWPERASHAVPDLLLALAWARHHPQATPAEAERAVASLRARLADPTWAPTRDDERAVAELVAARSLAGAPMYAPLEWVPTVRHVAEYAIDNTVAFLAWLVKIVHFHAFLDDPRTARADFPRLASAAEVCEKSALAGAAPSLWATYQRLRLHPLELRVEAAAAASPELARWRAFYDWFVPPRDGDADELRRMFAALARNLEALYSDAAKERQKFLEHATTLQAAIKPFLGERSRVVCSVAPDLEWSRVAAERQVVYCALGAMIDPHGAAAMAKMLVQDIAAWVGQRYQYGAGANEPFYLVADEIGAFINEPFIDLLNKSRGAGLRVCVIGQTTPDLEKQLGPEGAKMVKGNLNTFIQLRSQLGEDAEDFSRRAGEVNVVQESRSVSLSPALGLSGNIEINGYQANESRSYQSREVKRVPPMAILNLPRGQAFIHAQGQVFLVCQGLLAATTTRWLAEIGMRDDAAEVEAEVGDEDAAEQIGAATGAGRTASASTAGALPRAGASSPGDASMQKNVASVPAAPPPVGARAEPLGGIALPREATGSSSEPRPTSLADAVFDD